MMYDTSGATASQLDIVARELAVVSRRIGDATQQARGLAAATDWQAKAAQAFHSLADEWAREISSLGCLAETARVAAAQARDAAWRQFEAGC
ncbi:hypothetical protein [Microbacterium sp. CFBP9034]|uniref:hypothetical protein n=1 Tax=Microbacterium sp. CFBP9034 TaxID=3096540 RepID=UPI002A6B1BB7|nr:hypothetical protein [Microbacterium sp. CFBP9034]MDY0908147.1 hypothetical protein [Microbacterium sp. CFBP9034]